MGGPRALRTIDGGFPRLKADRDDSSAVAVPRESAEGEESDGSAAVAQTRDSAEGEAGPAKVTNPGFVLLRDGAVVARARQIGNHRLSVTADPPARGKFTTALSVASGPRVQMRSSAFATAVRQVTFRDGKEVVHFDPPPGSAAEARLEAIAASPWKRVVYPVAAGVGKSGWAIAMLLLLPLLGRILEPVLNWISERIPDFEIPWPDWSLPQIPWPDINLPSISLPSVSPPGWVEFLLEYSKVWVPLVIGVAIAVVTIRHSRRSRAIKESWQSGQQGRSGRRPGGESSAEGEHASGGERVPRGGHAPGGELGSGDEEWPGPADAGPGHPE